MEEVNRSERKPYCLELVLSKDARDKKRTYCLNFSSESDLYTWMDEIYKVSCLPVILAT